jgi:arabinose-5-phosphate isomerase
VKYLDIAKDVIKTEMDELQNLYEKIDESFNKAVELILKTDGKVVIFGVGKSGLIGAKISATLASTGTSAISVHPVEAMHGDLGMLSSTDLVILISYSGESSEVVALIPHIKRFNLPIITIAGDKNSTLANSGDLFLDIHVAHEACPLDTAPTSSTTNTLVLGDALAVALMRARGFGKDDFASFHPGGSLGKRLFVKLDEFVQKSNLPIIDKDTILQEAIVVMSRGRLGNVLIENRGVLVGVLSDGDLRRALLEDDFSLQNRALLYATKNPYTLDDSSILASKALEIIEEKKIQMIVLVDNDNKIDGIVHLHTLIEAGIKQ